MKRLRSPVALLKARIHPVVWLFAAKLALLGFALVFAFNLQFPALTHRAVLAWIQSGFTDQAALAIVLVALPYSIGLSFFGRSAYQLWRESWRQEITAT